MCLSGDPALIIFTPQVVPGELPVQESALTALG